jgi:dTDP-L-oleandrosyltransferase
VVVVTTRHILFLAMVRHGLVFPTLAVVAELIRRGHRVTYLTSEPFAEPVAATGAEVVRYDSPLAGVDAAEVFAEDDAGALPHLLYLRENVAVLRAAEAHFGATAPDAVLYDDFPFIAGRLLAHRWRRPAGRLSVAFVSNEHYSFSQDMLDDSGAMDPLALPAFRARLTDLLTEYGTSGPVETFWTAIERFNLVFIPKAFQFAGDTFDERFRFVGPCFERRSFLGDWTPPRDGRPVVLVSLGTTFNDQPDFFRDCVKAFAGAPWHVVMTVGDQIDVGALGPVPGNIEVRRWVSHLAVLEHARACVTHGGMGTVMEALYFGCPIVAVPHSFDVMPMARRIAELGLGTVLRPHEVDGERLRAAVESVARDGAVESRVRRVQAQVRQAGGTPRAADEIEAYLRRAV